MKPFIKTNYLRICVGTSIFSFNLYNYDKSPMYPIYSKNDILPMCAFKGLLYGSFPRLSLLAMISSSFFGKMDNHLIPYNSYKITIDETGSCEQIEWNFIKNLQKYIYN